MLPPDSCQTPRFLQYLGYVITFQKFQLRGSNPLRPTFPCRSFISSSISYTSRNTEIRIFRFRLLRFRSPLLTESISLSFPPGTEMFHFPGFALSRVMEVLSIGFPHSDTHDLTPVNGLSWLFAAYRVLLRLSLPRHPLCALSSLTY